MKFEWDEQKRHINFRKHGIDFAECVRVFNGMTITTFDVRSAYGEDRFITMGLLGVRVVAIAHTESSTSIRMISARKATKREQILFYETIGDQPEAH